MLGAPQAATYPRPPASWTGSGLTWTLWDPGGSAGVTQLRRPPSPIWPAGSLQGLTVGALEGPVLRAQALWPWGWLGGCVQQTAWWAWVWYVQSPGAPKSL